MHPMSSARTAGTTSLWSIASWIFFALTVLFGVAFVTYWQVLRSSSADPQAGPLLGVLMIVGMGAAWQAAYASASIGAVLGLIGVAREDHRTRPAWAALVLNAAFALVTTILLFVLR
jgi:hypothetical protein